MKFSYSLLKQLLPGIPALKTLAEGFNAHSFEVEEVAGDMMEIKLYSNRYSDAASHLGIAREAAAIFSLKLKNPVGLKKVASSKGLVRVQIEEPALCSRYSARVFDLSRLPVTPTWMKNALLTCGINPINGVVDIMNYVMLEVGQPLHAFDASILAHQGTAVKMIVRRARAGEKIETLDGQTLTLEAHDLVVADAARALAIAGIKGGLYSGVHARTRRIIVEAANFNAQGIFQTSRRLNLRTDASIRFEHGLSPALVEWGMARATALLQEAGAKLVDSAEAYPKKVGDEVIEFETAAYEHLIGVPVSAVQAKKIFTNLGFTLEPVRTPSRKKGERFLVRVPAWRTDIENAEDLIEEVSRIIGYTPLKPQPPLLSIAPGYQDDIITIKDKVRDVLVAFQMDEVYNATFIGEEDVARLKNLSVLFGAEAQLVKVANPISEEKKYLRPSLRHLLIKNVLDNARFFEEVQCFEVGKVFAWMNGAMSERLSLGIAMAVKKNPKVLFPLKGIVEELLVELGLEDIDLRENKESVHVFSGADFLGVIDLLPVGKHHTAAVAELDLEKIMNIAEDERAFKPLPRYPSVIRDVSLVVPAEARIGAVMDAMDVAASEILEDIDLIDEYADEEFRSDGKQGLTFRLIFQAQDRTLSDEEVNEQMEKILTRLRTEFHGETR